MANSTSLLVPADRALFLTDQRAGTRDMVHPV
jgi:hypothetical protein